MQFFGTNVGTVLLQSKCFDSGLVGVVCMAVSVVVGAAPAAYTLEVGVATADITPPLGLQMWGYQSRTMPSEGAWDPLMAKALLLDDGESRAAIVALDLGRTPPQDVIDRIRKTARERYSVAQLLLTAIHTHAAPSITPRESAAPNLRWMNELEWRIIHVVGDAVSARRPVTVEVGYGSVDISYDRRVVNPDGSVTMLWSNHERAENTPVDQTVGVMIFKDKKEQTVATLVHYACHPVLFGADNQKYSADFPSGLCAYVEKHIGGTCLYLQGGCGEINPYLCPVKPTNEGYAVVRQEGEKVGKEVVRVAKDMRKIPDEELTLKVKSEHRRFYLRYPPDDERIRLAFYFVYGEGEAAGEFATVPATIDVETSMVLLGEQVAWVGFPGEFFDDFQLELREGSPIPNTYFVGYCNGYLSYFPTIQQAVEGGYGASYGTMLEVGAGEQLIDRAIINLYTLIGKLSPIPEK